VWTCKWEYHEQSRPSLSRNKYYFLILAIVLISGCRFFLTIHRYYLYGPNQCFGSTFLLSGSGPDPAIETNENPDPDLAFQTHVDLDPGIKLCLPKINKKVFFSLQNYFIVNLIFYKLPVFVF
jgi:hypothetical protein